MAVLDKMAILNVKDVELTELSVPEWGGEVCLGPMTIKERIELEQKHTNEEGKFNFKNADAIFDLLAMTIKTKEGENMFTKDDIKLLGDKNAKVVHEVFNMALTVSYQSKESIANIKKN